MGPTTEVEAQPKPHFWIRVTRGLLTFVGILTIILASGLLLLAWSCTVPSLDKLVRRFPDEKADFEALVSMSEQDSQFTRIDPDWLMTADGHQYDPSSVDLAQNKEAVPLTSDRWNQYRKLFSKDNISQGIEIDPVGGDRMIRVDSEGLLDRGVAVGYVKCGSGPQHRYEPCQYGGERGSALEVDGHEAYEYRHIDGPWYVYSQGPG